MGYKIKTFLFLLLLSFNLVAAPCFMALTLKDPKLSGDDKFWSDFEKELSSGVAESKAIENVYKRYKAQENAQQTQSNSKAKSAASFEFTISKKAQSELNRLPSNLRKKTDEFLELISTQEGYRELRSNPGRWNYEQLNYAKDTYSVRLNGGYRVLFELKNDVVTIKEINKNDIHKK